MGSNRRLRSSIRALQDTIINLRAVVPICIQRSRTHSFREEDGGQCSSFHSIYYTPHSSSSPTSSSASSSALYVSAANEGGGESDDEGIGERAEQPEPAPGVGQIISSRFFFTPRTTRSIMEEAGVAVVAPLEGTAPPEGEERRAGAGEEGSVTMVVASDDPYRDFRASMAEMVEAHGVREWPRLQELLLRYLRLNHEKTHKVIVLAFLDLVMHLLSQGRECSLLL